MKPSRFLANLPLVLVLLTACDRAERPPQAELETTGPPAVAAEAPAASPEPAPSVPATPEIDESAAAAPRSLATLESRAQARVHCVWFSGPEGPRASGGTTELFIRVEPNEMGVPAVGVIEEFMKGTGNQWKAASWMAAFTACAAVLEPMANYEFQVRVSGHIDGPSAGMLTTATMLALLTGAEIRPDATMTGTINPDGSAGPVGGIPQKMEGAKAAGMTRFGYPIGCRNARDLKTGRTVDLHDKGAELGLEVKEIRDLADAYELMTGQELPRYEEATESDMELPEDRRQQIKAQLVAWQAEFDSAVPLLNDQLARLPEPLRPALDAMIREVESKREHAERFEESGMVAAALGFWSQAAVLCGITRNQLVFVNHLMRSDFDAILAQIETLRAVEGRIDGLRMELAVRAKRTTVGGQVNAVTGFHGVTMAQAFADLGAEKYAVGQAILDMIREGTLGQLDNPLEVVGEQLAMPLLHYAAAEAFVRIARQQMDLAADEGDHPALDVASIGVLAKGYGSAAAASLGYFDSLVTENLQAQAGLTAAQAQQKMGEIEFTYPIVRSVADQALWTRDGAPELELLRLAAGAQSYVAAGSLVNKHYALGAETHADGSFILGNRRALTYQLDLARKRARQAAGRCKERLGFIPSAARTAYQRGIAFREGTDEDKLTALEELWSSTFWSDLTVLLASG